MGEGCWVEVRVVVDGGVDLTWCVKAVRQLRKELAEEGLPTQEVVGADGQESAIAVALVGEESTLVGVLRDWIRRRKGPEKVVVTLGEESIEMERTTFDERAGLLAEFLGRRR
jgi:hypothetical protein